MKEKINDVLYEDVFGFFSKLRAGNFEEDETQINFIKSYVEKVVEDVKNNVFNKEDIMNVITIIYTLLQYPQVSWTGNLAWKIYNDFLEIGE